MKISIIVEKYQITSVTLRLPSSVSPSIFLLHIMIFDLAHDRLHFRLIYVNSCVEMSLNSIWIHGPDRRQMINKIIEETKKRFVPFFCAAQSSIESVSIGCILNDWFTAHLTHILLKTRPKRIKMLFTVDWAEHTHIRNLKHIPLNVIFSHALVRCTIFNFYCGRTRGGESERCGRYFQHLRSQWHCVLFDFS